MNRTDFLKLIEDNAPVDKQAISEVYSIIDIFPYFQTAHLILLKGLNSIADVKFESQLRNSAIHVADREVLYYLLKEKQQPSATKTTLSIESPVVESPVIEPSVIDPPVIDPPVVEQVSAPEEFSQNDGSEKEGVEKEQTVIETAMNSNSLINDIEEGDDSSGSDKSDNNPRPATVIQYYYSQNRITNLARGMIQVIDEDQSIDDDKIFFMDPGIAVPEEDDLLELESEESSNIQQEEEIVFEIEKSDDSISKKQIQLELIDKFIIANPRIEPNRDKSAVPNTDLSDPYTEEHGGFVTETLAKIYIGQGYYSKAIDIYEKLSLKFPEKAVTLQLKLKKLRSI